MLSPDDVWRRLVFHQAAETSCDVESDKPIRRLLQQCSYQNNIINVFVIFVCKVVVLVDLTVNTRLYIYIKQYYCLCKSYAQKLFCI